MFVNEWCGRMNLLTYFGFLQQNKYLIVDPREPEVVSRPSLLNRMNLAYAFCMILTDLLPRPCFVFLHEEQILKFGEDVIRVH